MCERTKAIDARMLATAQLENAMKHWADAVIDLGARGKLARIAAPRRASGARP